MKPSVSLFERLGGRQALVRLLNHFYADVQQHRVIGPIFDSQIENWPEHIENIADFWTQVTGGPPNYSGRMPARHIPLGLREEHFQAWLGLWDVNCRLWAAPGCADELVAHARQIALRLREFCSTSNLKPQPQASVMKLTLFSDYSLRILMFAALRGEHKFSVDDVAQAYGLSRHHAAKAVNFLTRGGYLRTQRGRGGGIRLGHQPQDIVIGRLVRQTESGSPLVECFDAAANTCPLIQACLLKQALGKAWAAFFAALDDYTLADLVRAPASLRRALEMTP